jgi:predicted GIY-YIG superfamily endonuclease
MHEPTYLYILRCSDGTYYVGTTRQELDMRVWQHQTGALGGYTASRRPVALVYAQDFADPTEAIARERQVKRWSRRKKEALIAGAFDQLPDLASRRRRS